MTTNWPGTETPRSTNNAFTGQIACCSGPLSNDQHARSPEWSRYLSRIKQGKSVGPWPAFRDRQLAKQKPEKAQGATPPAHPVMDGLSARARQQLGKGLTSITIGTKADTDRRRALVKASI